MGDPLSTLSAIVGLADVVFRTSSKLYNFFSDLHSVPREVKELSNSLLTWKSVSTSVTELCTRYEQSILVTNDGVALTGVLEALKSCQTAFASIELLVGGHLSGQISRSARFARDMKWILDSKRLRSAQQSLDSSKLDLITALFTVARFSATFQSRGSLE